VPKKPSTKKVVVEKPKPVVKETKPVAEEKAAPKKKAAPKIEMVLYNCKNCGEYFEAPPADVIECKNCGSDSDRHPILPA
jgi:Zn finger protein HypA/HybF involved in hydrogenase expression